MTVNIAIPDDIQKKIAARRKPDDIEFEGQLYRLRLGNGFYQIDKVGPQWDDHICNIPAIHDDPEIRKLIVAAAILAYDNGIRDGMQCGRDILKNDFKNLFGL